MNGEIKSDDAPYRHYLTKQKCVAWVSQHLFDHITYTARRGLIKGMKRKGGLGWLPEFLDQLIQSNVYIGPGARILGNVRVGSNVVIGANSVVLSDIPDNCVAVGAPARVVRSIPKGAFNAIAGTLERECREIELFRTVD